MHADPSTPKVVSHEPASTPSTPFPGAQPHGGAPSAYQPQSLAHDHHGPVAHDAAPLTSEDLSALANYTGLGHEDLNDALRNGTVDASQQARVDALNRALEKLPPHSGLVYRGTDLPPDVLAQYQPGAVVTEARSSAPPSILPWHGLRHSPETWSSGSCRETGRDISSLSLISHEQEVLFPSGMQFYVLDSNDRSPDGQDDHRNDRAVEGIERWPREIAGKIFSTPEEAGVTPPTEEEIGALRKLFDEFQEQIDRVPEEDRWTEVSEEILGRHLRHRVRGLARTARPPRHPTPTPRGRIV